MSLAFLDIGTNTLRVLIRKGEDEIFRKNYYLFLGDEVVDGKLTYQGLKKLENTLSEISQIFSENGVNDLFAVATAFARKLNCEKELQDVFFHNLGKGIKVIDGKEEGEIVSLSIKNRFNIDNFSVFDIGGGSSEIIVRNGNDVSVKTLDIGSLFLKRQFFGSFPPTSEEKNELCNFVMKKFQKDLKDEILNPVFGVGGTITTIAFILSGEKIYNKEKINGFVVNVKDLERLYHSIEYLKPEKIKELYPIENGREVVLLSGVLLVLLFMNHFSLDSIIASDASLLEGLFFHFFQKK
ncbi:MAG: hypothetical protein N2999_01235 [Proteobacteria bacterium]|nr:hypothetical protein [Pseudomonadota bacterium]